MADAELTPFEEGVVIGLLLGEGHFGGDGRQPHVTMRMHVRHESLLRWLHARFPRSRLYGPYHHGDRHYFQWMARGRALSEDLMPILESHIRPELDGHVHARISAMRQRYPRTFAGRALARRTSPDRTMTSLRPWPRHLAGRRGARRSGPCH